MSVANYCMNEPPTSLLLACRGCLATDIQLYNIYDMCHNRLLEAYSMLLSTAVQVTDDLPHYLCSYCAALLLKCDAFRIKCIDSLIVLRNAQQQHLNVTTEHIKIIDRSTNFMRSELETIHFVSSNPKQKQKYSDISTDTDISSDSDESIDVDSTETETDCSVSDDETKHNFKAKSFKEHEIKIEYDCDLKNSNNDIKSLLKKYFDNKNESSGLLRDFKVNIDSAESKEAPSNIRNLTMKQLSEIINHIQYSSDTSVGLLKILGKDKCENKASKTVNKTKQKGKFMKIESKSNAKAKTINKQKVNRKGKVLQKVTRSKTALESKADNVNSKDSNTDTSLIQVEEVKIEISLEESKYDEASKTLDPKDDIVIANLKPNTKPLKCIKQSNTAKRSDPNYKGCKKLINGILNRGKTKNVKFSEELYATYNTEVRYLSKEEQMKEINERKESYNYKNAPFKCNFCYKRFVIEETYKNHMLLHNDISGKFVCDICQYHFMNKKRLMKHKQGHNKVFTCKECGHISRHGTLAAQHYRWHGGKKFSCKDCGKEFQKKSSQYGHIKICHPTSDQLVRCEICGDSFNGVAGLQYHDNKTHREMRSPECHCSGCDTQFYCSDAFKAHQGTDGLCDTTYKYCVRCGMSYETEQLLKEHEIEQRKPQNQYTCDVCNKSFKLFGKLKRHQWRHSTTFSNNIKHVKVYSERKETSVGEGDGSNEFICEICGKLMKNAGLLKLHYNMVHSTEKPFKCTICPKAFKAAAFLVGHMRVHTGERPYQCQHCSKAFQNPQNLKRHDIVHTGERPHSCDVCGKSFQTASYVKEHVQTVHMKIPMPPRIRRRNKKT